MTPDMSQEDPVQVDGPTERSPYGAVEWTLLGLVLLLAAVIGLPQVVISVRDGSLGLETVFYPVLLVAFAVLAWTRRSRG